MPRRSALQCRELHARQLQLPVSTAAAMYGAGCARGADGVPGLHPFLWRTVVSTSALAAPIHQRSRRFGAINSRYGHAVSVNVSAWPCFAFNVACEQRAGEPRAIVIEMRYRLRLAFELEGGPRNSRRANRERGSL